MPGWISTSTFDSGSELCTPYPATKERAVNGAYPCFRTGVRGHGACPLSGQTLPDRGRSRLCSGELLPSSQTPYDGFQGIVFLYLGYFILNIITVYKKICSHGSIQLRRSRHGNNNAEKPTVQLSEHLCALC